MSTIQNRQHVFFSVYEWSFHHSALDLWVKQNTIHIHSHTTHAPRTHAPRTTHTHTTHHREKRHTHTHTRERRTHTHTHTIERDTTHTTHTHTHPHTTHTGIPVLSWMSQLSNTEHVLLSAFSWSVTNSEETMHACGVVSVCVLPLWWFVCVFTLMCMSWLSKDWNKASKSKRQVCYIAEYKCPHYGASLMCPRKSFGWKTPISEREKNNN